MNDNKMKNPLNWPTKSYFTLKELFSLNPTRKEITMRVRVEAAKKSNEIVSIGTVPRLQGRPQLVFAYCPVTQLTIDRAKAEGIVIENENSIVNALNISPVAQVSPVSTKTSVGV